MDKPEAIELTAEQALIEGTRRSHDAELLANGAGAVLVGEKVIIHPTEEQIEGMRDDMNTALRERRQKEFMASPTGQQIQGVIEGLEKVIYEVGKMVPNRASEFVPPNAPEYTRWIAKRRLQRAEASSFAAQHGMKIADRLLNTSNEDLENFSWKDAEHSLRVAADELKQVTARSLSEDPRYELGQSVKVLHDQEVSWTYEGVSPRGRIYIKNSEGKTAEVLLGALDSWNGHAQKDQ